MTELREKINNIVEEKNTKIIPENIKAGTQIFDVTGSYTSDATAVSGDIVKDKIAYVNGEKIIGTMEVAENDSNYNAAIASGTSSTFAINSSLVEIDFIGVDLSNITSFSNSFSGFTMLKKVRGIGENKATNLANIFYNCTSLEELELFDTSKATRMNYAFYCCRKLKEIPFFDFSSVTSLYSTFLRLQLYRRNTFI